jgi:hypothetical protein
VAIEFFLRTLGNITPAALFPHISETISLNFGVGLGFSKVDLVLSAKAGLRGILAASGSLPSVQAARPQAENLVAPIDFDVS